MGATPSAATPRRPPWRAPPPSLHGWPGRSAMADRLAVLTYHRIADAADGPPGIISPSPPAFERQVRWLARARRPVSLDAVLRARTEGAPLPARAVLVTFDDGYEDFAEVAWPILRRHGVPAALFVPTAFPGSASGFWWDRLWVALRDEPDRAGVYRALRARVKALPHDAAMELVDAEIAARRPGPTPAVLDWPALRALAADGVAVCAHTRTHPLLHR